MHQTRACVKNAVGLHARPAANFAKTAAGFSCQVKVGRPGEKAVNAKSIVQILSQGFSEGTELEITAEGGSAQEEKEAVETLAALLEEG